MVPGLGLVEQLLLAALVLRPDGFLVEQQLRASALPVAALPASAFTAPVSELWLVFHRRTDWERAFYLPPTVLPPELAAVASESGGAGGVLERLVPGTPVPRLFLYAPYYESREGELVPVATLAIDVAEKYFHALAEAFLAHEQETSAWRRFAEERAPQVMRDVPEAQRLEAYASAIAGFAAHVLATANEIERALRRQQAAGKDPCRLLDPPVALFAQWPRLFTDGWYPGHYESPIGWQTSRGSLEPEDRERFIAEVFGGAWTGEARRDFAWLCGLSG